MARSAPHLGPVLRNRNFLLLWSAQIVSQLAFNMLNFVLIAEVYLVSSSSLAVSLLILSIGVPSVIFGLLAGVYVDRWNKKWVLVTTNLLRAFAVLLYLLFPGSIIGIYAVTFLISSITQFFAPAEASTIPALVSRRALVGANTLFLFTLYGSFIGGYAIAGPIQHLFGERFPIVLAAGAYLLATALTFMLPSLPRQRGRLFFGIGSRARGVWHELSEGFAVIRRDHRISRPILFLTLSQTLVGVVIVLLPAFSEQVLHISIKDASYILVVPAGVGMVLGAVLTGLLTRWFNPFRLVGAGVVLAGLTLIGVSLSRGGQNLLQGEIAERHSHLIHQGFLSIDRILSLLSVVGFAIFLLGFASSLVTITAQTLLQRATPERIRGRVFGTLNMLVNVAATVPLLVAGGLADLTSVLKVFAGLGTLVIIWGAYELWRSRLLPFARERRHLPRP